MHSAANTSRFLIDRSLGAEFADPESSAGRDSLFQHIVVNRLARAANSLQFFNELAHRFIRLAEHALSLRHMKALEEVSQALMNLPIAESKQIGGYYQALVINRNGRKHEAISLLETISDRAPRTYRARAIQSLGGIYHELDQPNEALRLYPEALRLAESSNVWDLLTRLLVHLEVSCIKSERGDHRGALADYEKLLPLVQILSPQNPLYFHFYHNELAVEFTELGRVSEAKAACAIALASPFASTYPEWSATRDEIAAKRTSATPSVVAINRPPEAEPSLQLEAQPQAKHSRKLSFDHAANSKDFFQRSVYSIPATATNVRTAISILDRVLICIAPRAPPAL